MNRRPWQRDELLLAMNLYCQLPFGKLHARNARVIELATMLERTPSSVAMKLCNLASLDPAHRERGIRGLSKASHADRGIWEEFHQNWNRLAVESEALRQARTDVSAKAASLQTDAADADMTHNGATERVAMTRVRLAQQFFRRAVLASYDGRCCISEIPVRSLLVASHIMPWSRHPESRADPRNGLCLSSLHDAAFDRGLIAIDSEFRLVLSSQLREHMSNATLKQSFEACEGKAIRLPNRFRPSSVTLDYHRNTVFRP